VKIISVYSHKRGLEFIKQNHPGEWIEIQEIIEAIQASQAKTKVSEELTMPGELLYSPKVLNKMFKDAFEQRGWKKKRIRVRTQVVTLNNLPDHIKSQYQGYIVHTGYREIDAVKNKLGVEIQFGKYAFMIYNVAAKMSILNKRGHIDAGVEIVPMKRMTEQMSTGVSYFEQVKADLEMRGEADIDIPVLIVGIDDF